MPQHQTTAAVAWPPRTPEAVHAALADAANRADVEAFVAVFEPDAAMVAPPEGRVVRGHDAIRRATAPLIALQPQMEIDVVGKLEADGLALTHARWRLAAVAPDGTAFELEGRGTIVSRRQPDATWRIVLDNPLSPD